MHAVFHLQKIIRSRLVSNMNPVLGVFLHIKKAFPSVDTEKLIDLLHDLGHPALMAREIASTFAFNVCRLHFGFFVFNKLPINMGVQEGDIESPPLFKSLWRGS